MKLEISKKWKWVAMDQDGVWFLYGDEPRLEASNGVWGGAGEGCTDASSIFSSFPSCDWKDSLHEVKDGELVKYVDLRVDDKVMVKNAKEILWLRRRFIKFLEGGKILCFSDGRDSWTGSGFLGGSFCETAYDEWHLPTEEDLK